MVVPKSGPKASTLKEITRWHRSLDMWIWSFPKISEAWIETTRLLLCRSLEVWIWVSAFAFCASRSSLCMVVPPDRRDKSVTRVVPELRKFGHRLWGVFLHTSLAFSTKKKRTDMSQRVLLHPQVRGWIGGTSLAQWSSVVHWFYHEERTERFLPNDSIAHSCETGTV